MRVELLHLPRQALDLLGLLPLLPRVLRGQLLQGFRQMPF